MILKTRRARNESKPSDEIIDLVKDTVTIREVLKPIYNFKAH